MRLLESSRSLGFSVLGASLAFALSAGSARAASLCVNPGGAGGCFSSVQAAIDAAASRDTISIAAGTYPEAVSIPAHKGRLTLSGAGASVTTLAGTGVVDTLEIIGPGVDVAVSGVTISGGNTPPGAVFSNAGVDVGRTARGSFSSVVITGNDLGLVVAGSATIVDSTIAGNANTGVLVGGRLRMARCVASGNGTPGVLGGGGLSVSGGRALVSASTISGNVSMGLGGAYRLGSGVDVSGPYTSGSLSLESSTVAGNVGTNPDDPGISVGYNHPKARLRNVIVAGNTAAGSPLDCHTGPFARLSLSSVSLIEDPTGCVAQLGPGAALLTGDPMLGPLQNNGGPTSTMALLPGSPAIGVLTLKADCKAPDQRGVARSVPCDLGAFEAP